MFCGNCGNKLSDEAVFCGKCGAPQKGPPPEEPAREEKSAPAQAAAPPVAEETAVAAQAADTVTQPDPAVEQGAEPAPPLPEKEETPVGEANKEAPGEETEPEQAAEPEPEPATALEPEPGAEHAPEQEQNPAGDMAGPGHALEPESEHEQEPGMAVLHEPQPEKQGPMAEQPASVVVRDTAKAAPVAAQSAAQPVVAAPDSALGAPPPPPAPLQAPVQPATAFADPLPSIPQSAFSPPSGAATGAGGYTVPESAFGPGTKGGGAPGQAPGGTAKSKTPLLLGIVGVVLAVIIGVLVYQNTGDRVYTRLLNRHAAAIEQADGQKLVDMSAEMALWGDELFAYLDEDMVAELTAELYELRYEYGSDLKVVHKLISVQQYEPKEMDWLFGYGYFDIEQVAELYVYSTVEGAFGRDATQQYMYAVKLDGKWYLMVDGTY